MKEQEIYLKLTLSGENIKEVKIMNEMIEKIQEMQKRLRLNNTELELENELLTNEDVAKLLKCTVKGVIEKRSKGVFPTWTYTKIPGVGYRFKKKELLKFLNLE